MARIEEADFGMTELAFQGQEGRHQPKKGEHLIKFYKDAIQDHAATQREGRPIFRDVEMIEIRAPGRTNSVIKREVGAKDKMMFGEQYARWKASDGSEELLDGTPLEAWPLITKAQVEEFRFLGIRTVENLAEMADSNVQGNMGMSQLKQKAQAFLAAAAETAPISQLQAELAQRDNKIAALEKHNADLSAKLDEVLARLEAED